MAPTVKRYSLFVDESSQTKHRYLTLGCLAVENAYVKPLEFSVWWARNLELKSGEMKWAKISGAKLNVYKLVVDRFFDLPGASENVHFHSLVVDTSKIRDDLYNQGDRELGFNKEVYQLLLKCAKLYPNAVFDVYADERQTNRSLDELKTILNNGVIRMSPRRQACFRNVQFCDSKKFLLLQMTDILLGAPTFQINGHHLKSEASAHKCHMSNYILDRAKIVDPTRDTKFSGRYTIWHRKLRDEGPAGTRSNDRR